MKKSLFYFILIFTNSLMPFTIMIDPSGDAKHTGRVIQDTFERGITLQCAEMLKKELNALLPQVRVVVTRVPGETIQPLQNASFANRLHVDFYISIYFYFEPEQQPQIALFQYIAHPTDHWHKYTPLSFYNVCQAHVINLALTTRLGIKFETILQNKSLNPFFIFQGLFEVPFKPLLGIKAPALAIEAGICQKDDFKHLIKPIVILIQEMVL